MPIPRRWCSSATAKPTSAADGSRSRAKFATATMRSSIAADQHRRVAPVGGEQRFDEMLVELRVAVEAPVQALLGEAAEEVEQCVCVVRLGRAQPQRRAVAQDDVDRPIQECAHRADLRESAELPVAAFPHSLPGVLPMPRRVRHRTMGA